MQTTMFLVTDGGNVFGVYTTQAAARVALRTSRILVRSVSDQPIPLYKDGFYVECRDEDGSRTLYWSELLQRLVTKSGLIGGK